jgi:hypothetical protein
MTVADQSSRAWGFEYIPGKSSDLVLVLEQTRRVASADSTVFTAETIGAKFAPPVYR